MMVETLCDDHGLPIPDSVSAYRSHFGGQFVATCGDCGLAFAYWECSCEWSHNCSGGDHVV